MTRAIEKLSALAAKRARDPGLYGDGKGLYLRVAEGNAKSWVLRYMLDGRAREMGLGSYHDLSLAEARDRARDQRKLVKDGIDPIDERRERRAAQRAERQRDKGAMTFRRCAEAYIAAHEPGWRNAKHAAQWPSTLSTYVYPIMGALPVQTIDTGLVMRALEPIWAKKPETAGRVRGRIESVLDWATSRGYRQGDNPARWRGHLDNLLTAPSKAKRAKRSATGRGEHHAALPYKEIGSFMAELRGQEGLAASALQLTILTALRTDEVLGAPWSEINLADRVWTLPPERMKAEREHRVPLSPPAIAILEEAAKYRDGEFVFPGAKPGRPLSNMSMLMLLRRMGRDDLTVHGFRSTFSDWCSARTNFPAEVREMALAHAVPDKVEAAYRRGDLFQKRRQLMAAWARYCATPAAAAGGEVVAFGAAQ